MATTSLTRELYALIQEGRHAEAVERLQGVLRVGAGRVGGGAGRRRGGSPSQPTALPDRTHTQVSPGSRAALSLLAHCYYAQEEYEAAAQA